MTANNNNRTTSVLVASLFGRYILKPVADWLAQRGAFDELMSLDDHMLKDIGIARCEIPAIVAEIEERQAANENLPQRSKNARFK